MRPPRRRAAREFLHRRHVRLRGLCAAVKSPARVRGRGRAAVAACRRVAGYRRGSRPPPRPRAARPRRAARRCARVRREARGRPCRAMKESAALSCDEGVDRAAPSATTSGTTRSTIYRITAAVVGAKHASMRRCVDDGQSDPRRRRPGEAFAASPARDRVRAMHRRRAMQGLPCSPHRRGRGPDASAPALRERRGLQGRRCPSARLLFTSLSLATARGVPGWPFARTLQ